MANSLGLAEALREEHAGLQALLELLGGLAVAVDRRVDQAGEDGVDPDADGREVAGDREGHADDAALGGGVRGLADLAVLGGDRGGVDDRAALAVLVGLVLRHRRGGDADAVEGADQVDLDDLLEDVEVVGRAVLAVLADGAGRPADAGAVDERLERAELLGRLDRGDDLRRSWSRRTARTTPPISLARASPFSACRSRSATTTLAPREARWRAVASPRPDAPPVTIALMPLISMGANSID